MVRRILRLSLIENTEMKWSHVAHIAALGAKNDYEKQH
jgi:hypothetical protein